MKILRSLLLSTLGLLVVPSVTLQAQSELEPVGKWTVYPVFSSPVTDLVETGEYVYGVSGGNLFSYNPNTEERRTLNVDNILNDFDVSEVYYNHSEKYLAVVYEDSNIDLVYDDGRVINLPDIKAADGISGSRSVNHVSFSGDGRMYVATDFGVVIFDDRKYEVIRSGNFGEKISSVCEIGGNILILKDNKVYYISKDSPINRLDRFTEAIGVTGDNLSHLFPFKGGRMMVYGDNKLTVYQYNNNKYDQSPEVISLNSDDKLERPVMMADSSYHVSGEAKLWTVDYTDGPTIRSLVELPESLKGQVYSFNKGIESVWALDKDGLGLYSLSTGAQPTVKKDKYLPESMTVKVVASITPSRDGERLYFSNLGPTVKRLVNSGEGKDVFQQTCRLSNGKFEDMAPYPVRALSIISRIWQGSNRWLVSPSKIVEDPDDPETYFLGMNADGLYRVTNGEISGHFDETNSPLYPVEGLLNATRVFEVGIDRGGNLWVVSQRYYSDPDCPIIMILPADKRREDTSNISSSDWHIVDFDLSEEGSREPRLLFCKKSNMVFVGMNGLLAIDTRGTLDDFTDDKVTLHSGFTDQDGKTFSYTTILSLEEDLDGRVWVGTDAGVFEISNPVDAVNNSMIINHIKVPLNDGTNTAEYLLPSERIYGISTDNANRKWIATRSSGLFLVSQRGDKILKNFTTDNSILPDNMVHAVYADPRDNRVWIGTSQGLISYSSDASPIRDDFSDIYAYPNPVRPDYSGMISIVGLMDNTLVKITDAAGNLMQQVKAEGGMAR